MNQGWNFGHFGAVLTSVLGALVAVKPALIPFLPLMGPAAPIVGGILVGAGTLYGVMQDPPR